MIRVSGLGRMASGGLLVLLLLALGGCIGGGGDSEDENIVLPEGVSIEGNISAGADGATDLSLDDGNLVRVYIRLNNTTDQPHKVIIPACYTFIDPSEQNQNGLSIWRREITVPAKKTIRILLGTYCMNASRAVPSGGVTYELAGVTTVEDLKRLCDILKDRVLEKRSEIQSIVWKITSDGKLNEEDVDLLHELADGKALLKSSDETLSDKAEWLRLHRASSAER